MPRVLQQKLDFIDQLGGAVAGGIPFAAGKICLSEQHWLYYPIFLAQRPSAVQLRVYQATLIFHCHRQSGLFPQDPEWLLKFNETYAEHLRNLDSLGLWGKGRLENPILAHYRPVATTVPYRSQEPDHSVPGNESRCYLRHFRGKRVLLLSPFAKLLAMRATQQTFEAVWSKIGKPWFHPASVAAIEFPYGFDPATWQRFPTALDLLDDIMRQVDKIDFDVALIGAGGLGIPLASEIKLRGRIAISLGGHLQILFGVTGKRWLDREDWHRKYFNDAWIPMPAHYRPPNVEMVCDGGAYW